MSGENNPLSVPEASATAAASAPTGNGPREWDIGELLTDAWEKSKENLGVLIGASLLVMFVMFLVTQMVSLPITLASTFVQTQIDDEAMSLVVSLPFTLFSSLISTVINAIFMLGLYRLYISVARGEVADFGTIFTGYERMGSVISTQLLLTVVVAAGFLFFIIPSIILSLGLAISTMYAVDSDLGPVDCLKESWKVMDGQKLKYLLMSILLLLVGLVAIIPCGLGLIVFIPYAGVVNALVYAHRSGTL